MCPDPALLVAYLDKTLFSRDVMAIEQHVEECEQCTALLADMRRHRAADQTSRRRRLVIPVAVVAVVAIAAWAFRPGSTNTKSRETSTTATPGTVPAQATSPPPPPTAPTPAPGKPAVQRPRTIARATPPAKAKAAPTPAAPKAAAPKPAAPKPAAAKVERPRTPRIQWRTNDQVVERSTDGGMTWTTEYTADRAIRASVFVNADVGWLVGENGLVVRRTKNGWFGASAPAEGHITAVRATSPSKATVTLEDGRVFTTENGGVTWSSP